MSVTNKVSSVQLFIMKILVYLLVWFITTLLLVLLAKISTTPADLLTKCTDAALFSSTEDGYSVVYDLFNEHFGSGHATQELSLLAAAGGTTYDAMFQAATAGGM